LQTETFKNIEKRKTSNVTGNVGNWNNTPVIFITGGYYFMLIPLSVKCPARSPFELLKQRKLLIYWVEITNKLHATHLVFAQLQH
jgi:hypothetical protein